MCHNEHQDIVYKEGKRQEFKTGSGLSFVMASAYQQSIQKPARSQSSRLSSPCLKPWNTLKKKHLTKYQTFTTFVESYINMTKTMGE